MKDELINAIEILSKHLREDDEYSYGWQSSIAMSQIEAEHNYKKKTGKKYLNQTDKRIIANKGAKNFLILLSA